MWEHKSDYKPGIFVTKHQVSLIICLWFFHSFLQFYVKALLLQWWQGGREIIKGSGGSCVSQAAWLSEPLADLSLQEI